MFRHYSIYSIIFFRLRIFVTMLGKSFVLYYVKSYCVLLLILILHFLFTVLLEGPWDRRLDLNFLNPATTNCRVMLLISNVKRVESIQRWFLDILSVPKFEAKLYCICLSINLWCTYAIAVQICGKFFRQSVSSSFILNYFCLHCWYSRLA